MRTGLVLTAALYLSACVPPAAVPPCASTAASAKAPPALSVPAEQPTASGAALAKPTEIDRSVFAIPLPARTVCTVSGVSRVSGVELMLGEDLPLGQLAGAELRVHIPHEEDIRDSFVVEAELPGVSARAFVSRYSMTFHPTRAAIFELLVPRANADLRVLSANEHEIRLSLRRPRRVALGPFSHRDDAHDSVDGALPCDALSLDVRPFDPLAALSEPTGQGALTQERIALASKPGGTVVGRIKLEAESQAHVSVLERQKGWVKIAYPAEEAIAFGWVREQLVVPSAPELPLTEPTGGPAAPTESGSARRIMVCSHAVPFRAKVGKSELTIGIVHPNEVIPIVRAEVGRRRIDLANHGLMLDDDAELWVADADVKDCREQGP